MIIGLLLESREPDSSTGYTRVEGDINHTVVFPVSSGYGVITHIGIFDSINGGAVLEKIKLPEPVDCHEGVVPIVHHGKLLRGIDVTAKVKLKSADLMNF